MKNLVQKFTIKFKLEMQNSVANTFANDYVVVSPTHQEQRKENDGGQSEDYVQACQEEIPCLKYLMVMSINGIFSAGVVLPGELDERIVRALDAEANKQVCPEYGVDYGHSWILDNISPTEALNRLAAEFGYKLIASGRDVVCNDATFWTLKHVGI